MLDATSLPTKLSAVHVYRALSTSSAPIISNELSSWTMYLLPLGRSWPSFVHVTVGFGTPLVGHWMVILVLVSAVTLSPIVNLMGLRSWAFIVSGLAEVWTKGLIGPEEANAPNILTKILHYWRRYYNTVELCNTDLILWQVTSNCLFQLHFEHCKSTLHWL